MIGSGFTWLYCCACTCALIFGTAQAAADGAKQTPKEAKVDLYVQIINAESKYVLQSYDGYTKRVQDLRKGPTCKEPGPQSWLGSMGESQPDTIAGYRKGLAKAPKLEVDGAATQMVDALDALYAPTNEASAYYFLSKFNKDGCKRGAQLHPILMANWTKYINAEQVVRAFVDHYTDERDAADLNVSQKKYGKALHYYQQKLMIDAKTLIRIGNVKTPDLAAIRPRLTAFAETITEATAVVEREKKTKNADALYQGGYEQLLTTASYFKSTTEDLVRDVDRDAKDPQSASTRGRSAAHEDLLNAYNALVEQSNQTMYTKNMK